MLDLGLALTLICSWKYGGGYLRQFNSEHTTTIWNEVYNVLKSVGVPHRSAKLSPNLVIFKLSPSRIMLTSACSCKWAVKDVRVNSSPRRYVVIEV